MPSSPSITLPADGRLRRDARLFLLPHRLHEGAAVGRRKRAGKALIFNRISKLQKSENAPGLTVSCCRSGGIPSVFFGSGRSGQELQQDLEDIGQEGQPDCPHHIPQAAAELVAAVMEAAKTVVHRLTVQLDQPADGLRLGLYRQPLHLHILRSIRWIVPAEKVEEKDQTPAHRPA